MIERSISAKLCGVANLILHVVMPLKDREMPARIGPHHRVPILVVLLPAAEFEPGMRLQRLRKRRKGPVLQAVRELAAQVAIG